MCGTLLVCAVIMAVGIAGLALAVAQNNRQGKGKGGEGNPKDPKTVQPSLIDPAWRLACLSCFPVEHRFFWSAAATRGADRHHSLKNWLQNALQPADFPSSSSQCKPDGVPGSGRARLLDKRRERYGPLDPPRFNVRMPTSVSRRCGTRQVPRVKFRVEVIFLGEDGTEHW
jgi:hypothetical protein